MTNFNKLFSKLDGIVAHLDSLDERIQALEADNSYYNDAYYQQSHMDEDLSGRISSFHTSQESNDIFTFDPEFTPEQDFNDLTTPIALRDAPKRDRDTAAISSGSETATIQALRAELNRKNNQINEYRDIVQQQRQIREQVQNISNSPPSSLASPGNPQLPHGSHQ
jgi:hypothetical protein